MEHHIRIDLDDEGTFLPPMSIVRALDGSIGTFMRQILIGPFTELATLVLLIYDGDRDLARIELVFTTVNEAAFAVGRSPATANVGEDVRGRRTPERIGRSRPTSTRSHDWPAVEGPCRQA